MRHPVLNLPRFVWLTNYRIGDSQIDAQHRRLFDIANDFVDGLESGEGDQELEDCYRRLLDYVNYHFDSEEKLMRAAGYPQLACHIEEHNRLRDRLKHLWTMHCSGQIRSPLGLAALLNHWLITHVGESDSHIGEHLRAPQPVPVVLSAKIPAPLP